MTIPILNSEILYPYTLNGYQLPDCSSVRDLGIEVDKRLTFNKHITQVANSALRSLGFLVRTTYQFKNISSLITLFNSLVKSKLLYGSMLWFPIYDVHVGRLEYIQRRFLKFLMFKRHGVYPQRGVEQEYLLDEFNFLSLKHNTVLAAQMFLFKLCNDKVDCPALLEQLPFCAPPANTRRHHLFYPQISVTNICGKAPLYRACTWFNKISNTDVDLFADSEHVFKRIISSSLGII